MKTDEPVHLKGSSWVIPGPTNIGIVETNDGVYLIDSGNDKEAGRRINKILSGKNWNLSGIINTHSNADHIGGNEYLQRMHDCRIFSTQTEKAFIESPKIEASFLWGGFPVKELRSKFFEAKPSRVTDVLNDQSIVSSTMKVIPLPGHFFEMIGIMTNDNVCYLGDCMFGEIPLGKYRIPYIYDVQEYKATIERIKQTRADYYIMSHGEIETNITEIADRNLAVIEEIEAQMGRILGKKATFENILKMLCDRMDISLDYVQYTLVGNTVRSFLSYLYNTGQIHYAFTENVLYWYEQ